MFAICVQVSLKAGRSRISDLLELELQAIGVSGVSAGPVEEQ